MIQSRRQAREFLKHKYEKNLIDRCEYDYLVYKLHSYSDAEIRDYHVLEEVYDLEKSH